MFWISWSWPENWPDERERKSEKERPKSGSEQSPIALFALNIYWCKQLIKCFQYVRCLQFEAVVPMQMIMRETDCSSSSRFKLVTTEIYAKILCLSLNADIRRHFTLHCTDAISIFSSLSFNNNCSRSVCICILNIYTLAFVCFSLFFTFSITKEKNAQTQAKTTG